MSKGLHSSNIDYIAQADRIGRMGRVLNIITGCKPQAPHNCPWCYARNLVLHGRLKGAKSYPYAFAPTFHPERNRAIGGRPKLIFLNDMGDVGGNWNWRNWKGGHEYEPLDIALNMQMFAIRNPQHILLLLTKNPSWYRFVEWPDNVWCGFSASTNIERSLRLYELRKAGVPCDKRWMSLEPWLDDNSPLIGPGDAAWFVIGGLSGKDGHGVSHATHVWLRDKSIQAKRFAKDNCRPSIFSFSAPREYPDEWIIKQEDE